MSNTEQTQRIAIFFPNAGVRDINHLADAVSLYTCLVNFGGSERIKVFDDKRQEYNLDVMKEYLNAHGLKSTDWTFEIGIKPPEALRAANQEHFDRLQHIAEQRMVVEREQQRLDALLAEAGMLDTSKPDYSLDAITAKPAPDSGHEKPVGDSDMAGKILAALRSPAPSATVKEPQSKPKVMAAHVAEEREKRLQEATIEEIDMVLSIEGYGAAEEKFGLDAEECAVFTLAYYIERKAAIQSYDPFQFAFLAEPLDILSDELPLKKFNDLVLRPKARGEKPWDFQTQGRDILQAQRLEAVDAETLYKELKNSATSAMHAFRNYGLDDTEAQVFAKAFETKIFHQIKEDAINSTALYSVAIVKDRAWRFGDFVGYAKGYDGYVKNRP